RSHRSAVARRRRALRRQHRRPSNEPLAEWHSERHHDTARRHRHPSAHGRGDRGGLSTPRRRAHLGRLGSSGLRAFPLHARARARGRKLIGLVTAFTLGHSLSLALAFFEVVRIPVPPVEAVIALSIVFMAREAILFQRDRAMPTLRAFRRELIVVVTFGLLHG